MVIKNLSALCPLIMNSAPTIANDFFKKNFHPSWVANVCPDLFKIPSGIWQIKTKSVKVNTKVF